MSEKGIDEEKQKTEHHGLLTVLFSPIERVMSRLVEVQPLKRVRTEERVPDTVSPERDGGEIRVATEFEYFVNTLTRKQEELVEAVDELVRNAKSGASTLEAQYLKDVAKEFSLELQKTGERFRASLAALESQTTSAVQNARAEAEQKIRFLNESLAEDCRRAREEHEKKLEILRARVDSEIETGRNRARSEAASTSAVSSSTAAAGAGSRSCKRCGRGLGSQARFCDNCGSKLES